MKRNGVISQGLIPQDAETTCNLGFKGRDKGHKTFHRSSFGDFIDPQRVFWVLEVPEQHR